MPYPLCEHTMSSGIRCGSPALRGQKHCFYHTSVRTLLPKRFVGHERFRNEYEHGCRLFPMPLLEDATSIQTALMQVIHATLEGAIHFRSASIVLAALRTAQRNLALVKLEMAATSAAAMERELPSDAGLKAEVTWPNRADDQWETSYIDRSTASPPISTATSAMANPKFRPTPRANPLLRRRRRKPIPPPGTARIQARRHSRPRLAPPLLRQGVPLPTAASWAWEYVLPPPAPPARRQRRTTPWVPHPARPQLARKWEPRSKPPQRPPANSHCHSPPAACPNRGRRGRKDTRHPSAQTEERRTGSSSAARPQQTLRVCHPERRGVPQSRARAPLRMTE